jgi:hypothetical protein
MLKVA